MLTFKIPTQEEFAVFKKLSIDIYASELVKYKEYPTAKAAMAYAVSEVEALVPQGVHTPNHFIYFLQDENDNNVGYFWHIMETGSDGKPCSFLAYIYIHDAFRRKGYASEAIRAYEKHLLEDMRCKHVYFFVFRDNPAVLMYQSLGYQTAEDQGKSYLSTTHRFYMSKQLAG